MGERRSNSRRERQRVVTDEPYALGEHIRGRALASIRRRALAIVLDGVLFVLVATPLLLAATLGALWMQAPTLASDVMAFLGGRPGDASRRGEAEGLALVARRRPGAVPERFVAPLAAGDLEAAEALLAEESVDLMVDFSTSEPTYYDPTTNTLNLNRDVIFGPAASWISYAAMALAYFTLMAWIGNGKTPGKWLLGIRAVRLDGAPLRLWDAFSRAGGYAASLSMLGLGFLEARWDPNRQTVHDRVAGTVVIRDPRRRRPTAPTR
jgi:uncharacterized RDD family membrane protein YckC